MGKYGDRAAELFSQGYNCAQAVLGAFCDELGMDSETAMRLASSFGGGMGGLREVCGAASGMFMAAGLKFGYSESGDYELKKQHYALIKELASEFSEYNGSLICRELLGMTAVSPQPEKRTPEYYKKRPCKDIVSRAADIFGEYIARKSNDNTKGNAGHISD